MYEQIFMRKYFRTPHFYKTNLRPQTFPYLKSENLTKHTYKKKKKKIPNQLSDQKKKKKTLVPQTTSPMHHTNLQVRSQSGVGLLC